MVDLEVIEQFLDVDTDTKRLRQGKKKNNKNQYYYFQNRFYIVQLTKDKWMVCSDDDNTRRLLRKHTWHFQHIGYAGTWIGRSLKYWHQLYLSYEHPNVADHINNRTYDNRSENLRIVHYKENMRNKTKYKNNTSGKQGVYKDMRRGQSYWRVQIYGNNGKRISKCFSIDKLGDDAAKQLAIVKRRELERLYGYIGD